MVRTDKVCPIVSLVMRVRTVALIGMQSLCDTITPRCRRHCFMIKKLPRCLVDLHDCGGDVACRQTLFFFRMQMKFKRRCKVLVVKKSDGPLRCRLVGGYEHQATARDEAERCGTL